MPALPAVPTSGLVGARAAHVARLSAIVACLHIAARASETEAPNSPGPNALRLTQQLPRGTHRNKPLITRIAAYRHSNRMQNWSERTPSTFSFEIKAVSEQKSCGKIDRLRSRHTSESKSTYKRVRVAIGFANKSEESDCNRGKAKEAKESECKDLPAHIGNPVRCGLQSIGRSTEVRQPTGKLGQACFLPRRP